MDYFSEGEGEFLVMEYIAGHDLAELLELRNGPFPQHQVLRWADELLKLLDYLHTRDPPILHRDIKPNWRRPKISCAARWFVEQRCQEPALGLS